MILTGFLFVVGAIATAALLDKIIEQVGISFAMREFSFKN